MVSISSVIFYCTIAITIKHHTLDLKKWQDNSSLESLIYILKADLGLGSPLRQQKHKCQKKPTEKVDFTEIKNVCASKDIKKGKRNPQNWRDFPSAPVVTTPCFHWRGHGFDPWAGNWDPTCHVVQLKKKRIGENT